jgi:hypothetical protein
LLERPRLHAIKYGQIIIEHDLLAANQVTVPLDLQCQSVFLHRRLVASASWIEQHPTCNSCIRDSFDVSGPNEQLALYLNDHFAGSAAAIELLDDLIEHHPAHRLTRFFRNLREEIVADQETLREIIDKVDASESGVRRAAAWLAEKVGRAKLRFSGEDGIGLLQTLEMLVLGVTGKRLLWCSLGAISSNAVELQGIDFAQLELRATQQLEKLETERLQLSPEVLSDREHS